MKLSYLAPTAFAAPLFLALVLSADTTPPDFAGSWQMDQAKSHVEDGRIVNLTIQDMANKIKLVKVVRERNGKEMTSEFVCPADGSDCEFDEGGRKAKVSLWYDGSALIVLKTGGPKRDATTEWKMQLSQQPNTLSVDLTHIDPSAKDEILVFDRQASESAQTSKK